MLLSHDVITAPGAAPTRTFVFLHGILGSGANLRTLARRFVAERPEWAVALVDLRRHGGSLEMPGDDTLEQAASDVAALARALPYPARGVLGHSFGGKVALAWLDAEGDATPLEHVVVVDSTPSARPSGRGSEGTLSIVDAVGSLPYPFVTREAFVAAMLERNPSKMIAQWLGMSLRKRDDGYHFGPPIDAIRALLRSYFERDLWAVVETPPGPSHVHLVIGERSGVLDANDRQRAAAAQSERTTVDTLATDHWVHAEDLEGLLAVMFRVVPS